jgi:hypothetical protein
VNAAIWAIIGLVLVISAYVVGFDLWAQATGHATISGQVHTWMQHQLTGPIVVGVWFGVSVALAYHFLINR